MSSWPSKHFKRSEFACKCECGADTVDYGLVCALDELHEKLSASLDRRIRINVTSGFRCPSRNRACGGKPSSQHLRGRAADITVEIDIGGDWVEVPSEVVQDAAELLDVGGLGRYDTFTHIDTRHGRARW